MKCYDKQISKSQIYEIQQATTSDACLSASSSIGLSHTHTTANRFPMFIYGAPGQWRNAFVWGLGHTQTLNHLPAPRCSAAE